MNFHTLLFCCAICEHEVRDWPDRKGPDQQVAPVCRMCERWWTERTGKPRDGTMMDRRKALHVLALSNAIRNTAGFMEWEANHGRT